MKTSIWGINNKGFTLVELLIVVLIVGTIAAIAIPNVIGLADPVPMEVIRVNMRTVMTEIESHNYLEDEYPDFDNTDNFISEFKKGSDALAEIVEYLGDSSDNYVYENVDGDYLFSVKAEDKYLVVSSVYGFRYDLDENLSLE